MASSTPSIVVTPPTPVVAPVLNGDQVMSVVNTLAPLVKGQSLDQILVDLPVIVDAAYGLVQTALGANQTQLSATVVSVIETMLSVSPLPAADVLVLNKVVETLVPGLVALLVKYVPEIEAEVDSGCSACCTWLKSKLC